jgi:general secretion pathway protein K
MITCTLPRRQQGMALIIVLWLVVLLSVMASSHMRNTHTETQLAARQLGLAQARALAEGGIQHAIIELLANKSTGQRPVNGTTFSIHIGNEQVTLAIRDATGLVDLNAASADLLTATIRAVGADEATQRALADAILDWRDVDNLSHLNGAEDDDYRAAGMPWTARDGAFETIDELKYVLGMPQQVFDRLAPLLTVYSGSSSLDLEFAPPFLVAALTGDEFIATTPAWPDAIQDETNSSVGGVRSGTYHIYASVSGAAGSVASVEAVVRISAAKDRPFTILEWREPSRANLLAANEESG